MKRIHRSKRSKIKSTSDRLRLSVFCSNKYIYAQIINDQEGSTLLSVSSLKDGNGGNVESAKKVGELIAKAALKANIKDVVFDRGNRVYHGRIEALANAAREVGLTF